MVPFILPTHVVSHDNETQAGENVFCIMRGAFLCHIEFKIQCIVHWSIGYIIMMYIFI